MTISVTQLNNYIHGLLEIDGVLNDLSVAGEITNVKQSRDGWYFSLKDQVAAIDCFCYGNNQPVAGTMAVCEGKVNFWAKSGRLSFFVRRLTSDKNTGAAYLQFLQLKEKLQKEGLFDLERKKVVPCCCMTVGVVTSETGAVIHDIETVALRRQPFVKIVLRPVKVQGVGADVEIAQGIADLSNTDVDVIIVGRGGGSNEDLSVFNSELVVRAVANCPKPTVSAVGHGVDYTLCDFAADKRAVTPSEAAEFVTIDSAATKNKIYGLLDKMFALAERKLYGCKQKISYSMGQISSQLHGKIAECKTKIRLDLNKKQSVLHSLVSARQAAISNATTRISAANPANLLKRGYGVVSKNTQRVYSTAQVEVGDKITVTLSDGQLESTVTKVTK